MFTEKLSEGFFDELSDLKNSEPKFLGQQFNDVLQKYSKVLTFRDLLSTSSNATGSQLKTNLDRIIKVRDALLESRQEDTKHRSMLLLRLQGLIDREAEAEQERANYKSLWHFYFENIKNKMIGVRKELFAAKMEERGSLLFQIEVLKNELPKAGRSYNELEDLKEQLSKFPHLEQLLDERVTMYSQGDRLISNVAKSLSNRGYLDVLEDEYGRIVYIAKGEKYDRLEETGDTCPMGLSKNWFTPKVRYLLDGFEFSQHYFGNPENRIITGKEVPVKVEFHDYDNTFTMLFKGNDKLTLTTNQAAELLTNIETYALEALNVKRYKWHETPKITRSKDGIHITGVDGLAYSLKDTYYAIQKAFREETIR